MTLIRLETEAGPAFVDRDDVCMVTQPFQKKGHKPSCTVGLRGGHRLFMLYTIENLTAVLNGNKELLAAVIMPKDKTHDDLMNDLRQSYAASIMDGQQKRKRGRPRKQQEGQS